MVEKLLENGNSVTGLFFKPSKIKNENYTEILIPNMQDKFRDQLSKMYMEKGVPQKYFQSHTDCSEEGIHIKIKVLYRGDGL